MRVLAHGSVVHNRGVPLTRGNVPRPYITLSCRRPDGIVQLVLGQQCSARTRRRTATKVRVRVRVKCPSCHRILQREGSSRPGSRSGQGHPSACAYMLRQLTVSRPSTCRTHAFVHAHKVRHERVGWRGSACRSEVLVLVLHACDLSPLKRALS